MAEPFIPSHRSDPFARTLGRAESRRVRWRTTPRLAAAVLSLALAAAGCSSSDADSRTGARQANGDSVATPRVTGPLCDLLPSGTDPGNPALLAHEPADVALQWIPVLTTFEAAIRASGMAAELRATKGMTILAPTDDAFEAKFSEDTVDELILTRKDDLRRLLKSHMVDGSRSLAELIDAGSVTTLAGESVQVARADAMARIADGAETVCADYQATNVRIHVINKVLGDLPTTANDRDHRSH